MALTSKKIMNHRNSQSDSNNPFFKKKDGDSNNPLTTNLNDHPSPFNFSKMGHEEEQKKPKVKETTQRNPSFITGKIRDKITSIPLIYPSPKVESVQVKLVERTPDQSVQANAAEMKKIPAVESKKQEEDDLEKKAAIDESVREENISLLEIEFYSLLEESPLLLEETFSTREESSEITEESDPLFNEIFLMLDEESGSNAPKLEETESLEDMATEKIASMLEDEDDTYFIEETTSLLDEESTHFQEEESTAQKENTFLFEDSSYSSCEESSSFQEDVSSMLEKLTAHKENVGREKSPSQPDKDNSNQDDSGKVDYSSLLEELYCQLEETSSNQYETDFYKEEESPILDDIFPKCKKGKTALIEERVEEEILKEEESEEQFPNLTVKDDMPDECKPEVSVPIVKLPLLLAKLIVNINIFETMELCIPVDNVSKVEWSLQSYNCQVILPSTTVFLRGVLVADVELKGKGMKTIQLVKIPVSWSKTTKVEWLHQPKMPNKSQKEYIFTSQNGEDITTHFEFNQSFADEINVEIERIHFSVNKEFYSWAEQTQFDIQGCVTLSINLLQEQFVNL